MFHYDFEKRFLTLEEIEGVGLPIIDYDDDASCEQMRISWFTYSDLRRILEIYLTDDERTNAVQAFEKVPNGRGYVPLYCFETILRERTGRK